MFCGRPVKTCSAGMFGHVPYEKRVMKHKTNQFIFIIYNEGIL